MLPTLRQKVYRQNLSLLCMLADMQSPEPKPFRMSNALQHLRKPTCALFALVLSLIAFTAIATPSQARTTDCGKLTIAGESHRAVVRKGSVRCASARTILRRNAVKTGCGRPSQNPCEGPKPWRCVYTYSGDFAAVEGPFFCYVLKRSTPLSSGIPFWDPGKFKKAIVLQDL